MKNIITLSFILLFATWANAQSSIPNASFENWTPYSLGENPDLWTTSDSIARSYGSGANVFKGSDPQDGNFSLHLKTVNITVVVAITGPGIATNGKINFNQSTFQFVFSGGSADTGRWRFLTGWYKYMPMNPLDTGRITIALLRDNAGAKDTIAQGVTYFAGTTSTYTPFTTMIMYEDYINSPDTNLIIIQSSKGLNDPNNGVGSELVIDSLNFSGFVDVNELSDIVNSVNIYPTPAREKLHVDIDLKKQIDLQYMIFDMKGQKVLSSNIASGKETIDITTLSKGTYVLNISDRSLRSVYSQSFVVE